METTRENKLKKVVGTGAKFDEGKTRFDLLPFASVEDVAKVLTFGANKYEEHGWRTVPGSRARYFAATLRHLFAWWSGEVTDPESGLPHLAHAATNVLFLGELDGAIPQPAQYIAGAEVRK